MTSFFAPVVVDLINQNLQEGQSKTEEIKPHSNVSKVTSKATVKSQTSKVQTKSTVAVVTPTDTKMPRTTIKFSFTMDSFVIDLMNTNGVSIICMIIYNMNTVSFV